MAPREPHGRLGLALLEVLEGNTPAAQEQLLALRAGGIAPESEAAWFVAFLDARRHFPAVLEAPPLPDVAPAPAPAPAPAAEPSISGDDLALVADFRRGDYEAVRRAIEPQASPSTFRMKLLADAYYNLQDWTRAVRTYRLVLRDEPGNEPVTQYLADALVRLERYDDAIGFYRTLAEAHPTRPGFWRLIGDAAAAKGDAEVALAAYLKARDAGYDDPSLEGVLRTLQAKLPGAPDSVPGPTP